MKRRHNDRTHRAERPEAERAGLAPPRHSARLRDMHDLERVERHLQKPLHRVHDWRAAQQKKKEKKYRRCVEDCRYIAWLIENILVQLRRRTNRLHYPCENKR